MNSDFYKWIDDPNLLNASTLNKLRLMVEDYPFCQSVRFLFLKNLYIQRHPDFFIEVQKASVFVSDRKCLFNYLAVKEELWNDVFEFYSKQKKDRVEEAEKNSFALIDTFLETHVTAQSVNIPKPNQKAARMVMATHDYASLLMDDEYGADKSDVASSVVEEPMLKHQDLIDEFIKFADTPDAIRENVMPLVKEEPAPEPIEEGLDLDILDDDGLLTESLAKIYIKQKRYYKAIEIIKKLSLKYPEKSIYFADQIRFLEKLISNVKKT